MKVHRSPKLLMTAVVLGALFTSPAHAADDDGEINTKTAKHTNSQGQTTATITTRLQSMSPGERKVFAESGGEDGPSASRGDGRDKGSNCYYRTSVDPLSLEAYNRSVQDGFVLIRVCGGQLELTGGTNLRQREVFLEDGSSFVGYEDPAPAIPAPVPPQPEDFLDEAMGELTLPAPDINIGPDAENAVVNLPLSFWVGGQTEYRATAGLAGGVGVVVTARMRSVDWNFGEPASTSLPTGEPATLTCTGPGIPMTDTAATDAQRTTPECGHEFRWKSTPERTGGSGTWTVGASVQWEVTWQSTGVNPVVTGVVDDVAPTENTQQLEVLEYRDRLVDSPG